MKINRHLLFLRAWRHKSGDELSSSVHIERVGICEARSIAEKKQTMMGVPTIAKATLFRKQQECADLMYLSAVRCVIICTLLFSPTTIHAAPAPSQMQTTIDRLRQEKDELQVENNNLNNAVDKLKEDIEEKDKRYHCLLNLERERTDEMVAIRKEVINILTKRSSFTHRIFHIPAQVRWMGDLDTTAWYQAYTRVVDRANHLHGYNPTLTMMENAAIALHRMKTVMREPHWHPFVMKMVDDKPVEQIVEDNEVFVEIRRVWGNEICALVMRAVSELEEYNRSARLGVAVPWNFEEDKIFTYGQTIDQFGNALQEADAILERCSCGRFDHYNNARNSPDWTPPNEESVPTFSFSRPNTPNLSFRLPQAQNPTQEPTGEHHHHHHDHHQEPTDAHHLHVAHNEPRIQIRPRNEIHHEGGDHHHHHHHEPHLHLHTDDLEMALDAYQWPNDDGADHFDPHRHTYHTHGRIMILVAESSALPITMSPPTCMSLTFSCQIQPIQVNGLKQILKMLLWKISESDTKLCISDTPQSTDVHSEESQCDIVAATCYGANVVQPPTVCCGSIYPYSTHHHGQR